MKKIKTYNESIKDYLKPKPMDQIREALLKMNPYSMYWKIVLNDWEVELSDLFEICNDRMDKEEEKLSNMIDNCDNKNINGLVEKVADWVKKNGGNDVNVTDYGFHRLAGQIVSYGVEKGGMGDVIIYDDTVFDSFKELLKNFAICEAKNNNTEIDNYQV